ncbi:5 3 -nucleotidase [Fusarium agapanthi]|uniref:5 3 -nucleotidase n=1 Tax=Fusarium agapanthi TaxID=1803897 RepID=A0A9P5BEI6_9HYPO|nr:5 3 -nucleotidase [Fusarium agapanthi]
MRLTSFIVGAALLSSGANALNILLGNDDGFGSGNLRNLTAPSQYDLIPKGAPSVGHDPKDSQIWYYNGTPAACTFVALDYVLPKFANFSVPDLVVTGPNYGTNLGGFVWTLSGTVKAMAAVVKTLKSMLGNKV